MVVVDLWWDAARRDERTAQGAVRKQLAQVYPVSLSLRSGSQAMGS